MIDLILPIKKSAINRRNASDYLNEAKISKDEAINILLRINPTHQRILDTIQRIEQKDQSDSWRLQLNQDND